MHISVKFNRFEVQSAQLGPLRKTMLMMMHNEVGIQLCAHEESPAQLPQSAYFRYTLL